MKYTTKQSIVRLTIFCILVFSLCSCSSTPESRIDKKPELFVTYPPEIQAKIQSGDVDKGFTEEMVEMSKGVPEEKSEIVRKGKHIQLWKYYSAANAQAVGNASTGFSGAYSYPGFGPTPSQPILTQKKLSFVVEFIQGKVIGWKQY